MANDTLDFWMRCWPMIVDAVNQRDPILAGVLRSCHPIRVQAGRLVIGAPYSFHLERLRDRQKAQLLNEAVSDFLGASWTVEAIASGDTVEYWMQCWPTIVDAANQRDVMLAGVLRSCRPIRVGSGQLVIGAPYGFHLKRLRERQKARLLNEIFSDFRGTSSTVEAVFSGMPLPTPVATQPTAPLPEPRPTKPEPFFIHDLTPPERSLYDALRASEWIFVLQPRFFFGTEAYRNLPTSVLEVSHIRPDFLVYWKGHTASGFVVIEVDSDAYHGKPSERVKDEQREELFENLGFQFMRFSSGEASDAPLVCVERIKRRCVSTWGAAR